MVDLNVPAGEGPVDLPDIRLESLAWVKMLGKPAAEIEATDLEAKPVKLADYRGKVVLLAFWGTQNFEWLARMDGLAELHKRLKESPAGDPGDPRRVGDIGRPRSRRRPRRSSTGTSSRPNPRSGYCSTERRPAEGLALSACKRVKPGRAGHQIATRSWGPIPS